MTKQSLLYYVHRNIPVFYIIEFIYFKIIVDKISFIKLKIFKPKLQNLNSKLNGLHFVEFIQKYLY
jgi:hypothetical protein